MPRLRLTYHKCLINISHTTPGVREIYMRALEVHYEYARTDTFHMQALPSEVLTVLVMFAEKLGLAEYQKGLQDAKRILGEHCFDKTSMFPLYGVSRFSPGIYIGTLTRELYAFAKQRKTDNSEVKNIIDILVRRLDNDIQVVKARGYALYRY